MTDEPLQGRRITSLRYGSLFTGARGLDLAVHMLWPDAELAWWSEVDEHASASAALHTDAPNLGDIREIDWSQVDPVDVIVGGFPCQDLSHAGKRSGMSGQRSGLWFRMADAIDALRPSLVLLENVAGIYTAEGAPHDDMELDGDVLDGRAVGPPRAIDTVLGTLADLGFDAEWGDLRASDVGAPHQRRRWFCVAADRDRTGWREHRGAVPVRAQQSATQRTGDDAGRLTLPTPTVSDANGPGEHGAGGRDLRTMVSLLPTPRATRGGSNTETQALLPTPTVVDMGNNKTVDEWEQWTDEQKAKHGNGNGHGRSLSIEARLLPTPTTQPTTGNGHARHLGGEVKTLPTPTAGDGKSSRNSTATRHTIPPTGIHAGDTLTDIAYAERWGEYGPAITRWEQVIGRPAPPPTDDEGRLSADFVEWMMGWPPGWTLGVHGHEDQRIYELWLRDGLRGQPPITAMVNSSRSQRLKMCGNGVVPLQAAHAYRQLLDRASASEPAIRRRASVPDLRLAPAPAAPGNAGRW